VLVSSLLLGGYYVLIALLLLIVNWIAHARKRHINHKDTP